MKAPGARVLVPVRKDPAAMSNMEPESRIQGPNALRFNFLSILNPAGARVSSPAAMSDMQRELPVQGATALRFNLKSVLSVLSIIALPRSRWGHPNPFHL